MKSTSEVVLEALRSLMVPGVSRVDNKSETHQVTAYLVPSGEKEIIRIDVKPRKK